jgi:hypothetical protein
LFFGCSPLRLWHIERRANGHNHAGNYSQSSNNYDNIYANNYAVVYTYNLATY